MSTKPNPSQYFKVLKIGSLFIFLVFFHSCAQLSELANVSKPSLSVVDMNITGLTLQDIELTADVEIDNPNNVGIDLSSYSYALDVNEKNFVAGNEQRGMTINAKNSSIVRVPVTLTFSELLQTFQSMRDQDESDYSFAADFGFDLPVLGTVTVPVKYAGKIPVVKQPSISLSNFSVENLSLSGADLIVELSVQNPNAFQLMVDDLNFDLEVNGLRSFSGSINDEILIDRKSAQTIKLPFNISFLNAGMAAYRLLNSDENLEYKLTGSTLIGSDLPYFKKSNFDFDKSGSVDILK
ncbi:LEA type 2 family protein [Rhodohalobacter sp.]|uniref:LEA type 2 family protein n=1 Tax=Rhodohalobacter sp. TaxID=1974210 RepID=UPI002ACDFDF0|nr:LEA type 2 family protein [Rhodohalobacter sp.]MDZ7756433.1 LEA type 2 family protein [Rhodohalobacter sp.]